MKFDNKRWIMPKLVLKKEEIERSMTVLHSGGVENWNQVVSLLVPDYIKKITLLKASQAELIPMDDVVNANDMIAAIKGELDENTFAPVIKSYILQFTLDHSISAQELNSRVKQIGCHLAHDFELNDFWKRRAELHELTLATTLVTSKKDVIWHLVGAADPPEFFNNEAPAGISFLAVVEPGFFEPMELKNDDQSIITSTQPRHLSD
ncbi:hypothetical protein GF376_02155 [Candidatus Peregrinibacteria bacterium]|nr:hypothetical protein [Candidatus Peregrinibacteria bacterium]